MPAMTDEDDSTEVLLNRLNQLKATKASLQADLLRLKDLPSISQIQIAAQHGKKPLSDSLQQLGQRVAVIEEKCVLYRTAGWTVFEMDLDIGRRSRNARREEGQTMMGSKALGLGVRLETYHKGRFYEPFYLIFAKPSQHIKHGAKFQNPAVEDARREEEEVGSHDLIRLLRHTVPHFVPLSEIVQAYLKPDTGLDGDVGKGGLDLLESLMERQGLWLFLSRLHTHLQSFVSRRQQAIALSRLQLPGFNPSSLRAFSNDSFGQVSIRWELPCPSTQDLEAFEATEGILYPNNDDVEPTSYARHLKAETESSTALEVSIVYHDMSSDRVGRPTKQVSKRRQLVQALNDTDTPGLRCTFATVLVETIRSKVPAARRGTSNKHESLQVERVRRTDWEATFAKEPLPELEEALQTVTDLAWREEMRRVRAAPR